MMNSMNTPAMYDQMFQMALAHQASQQAKIQILETPSHGYPFLNTPYLQAPLSYRPAPQNNHNHQQHLMSGHPPPPLSPKAKAFSIDSLLNQQTQEMMARHQQMVEMKDAAANMTNPVIDAMKAHHHHRMAQHPYHQMAPYPIHHQTLAVQSIKEKVYRKCADWVNVHNGKQKRVRTIFTPEQLDRLEKEFDRQQYMVGSERYYLAASLNLSESQVKVWFQNRRIKWRKNTLENQHAKMADLSGTEDCDYESDGESQTSV